MDYNAFKAINGLSGSSILDSVMVFLANDLPAILVVLVAAVFLVPRKTLRHERRSGSVLATVAAGLGLLLAQPLAHAVDRARPFVAHPGHSHILISRSPDPSFPSDHATGAFALAMGIWLYDRTIGTVLLALAALLALARVYVGTHYPGDVIAGAVLGAGVALGLYVLPLTRRAIERTAHLAGTLLDGSVARLGETRAARSRA